MATHPPAAAERRVLSPLEYVRAEGMRGLITGLVSAPPIAGFFFLDGI
jgi:hypothetical protein